jgi:transcriptional regulator with GAF, ATPase, and Fis domain
MMDEGQFRMDLYYRMIGAELRIPPLRDRTEDIEMLAAFFVFKFIQNNQLSQTDYRFTISSAQMSQLKQYRFPGNIRELEKLINQACVNAMLANSLQLTIELPETSKAPSVSNKQDPVFFSYEQLCELLNKKIINSKGLTNQVKNDLINYLEGKDYKIASIANLMGMTEQSVRNLKSNLSK